MNNDYNYIPQNDAFGYNDTPSGNALQKPKGHAKGYATTALVLGILSFFCTCCCCCFYLLSPVFSIIAIVMAILARRDNDKKMPTKAVVGLILAILGLLLFIMLIAVEITFLSMPDAELERFLDEIFYKSYDMSFREYMNEYYPDYEIEFE